MNRKEQLEYCKKCVNRKMDMKQGLICNLTNEKATFQNECPDYQFDENAKLAPLDDKEGLLKADITKALPAEIMQQLKGEQNLTAGIISGLIVGLLGALLWAIITVVTEFQIGFMAVAIGAGVGLTIRKFGNGIDPVFGICGAATSLFSVLLGNFLGLIGFIANSESLGYAETLYLFNYSFLPELLGDAFSIMDLVFYAIAVYEGYKFSFRIITEKSMMDLKKIKK